MINADVAMHEAVGSGRLDLVAWLMRQGEQAASVTNNDGRAPLHIAAINNNIKMCKVSLYQFFRMVKFNRRGSISLIWYHIFLKNQMFSWERWRSFLDYSWI